MTSSKIDSVFMPVKELRPGLLIGDGERLFVTTEFSFDTEKPRISGIYMSPLRISSNPNINHVLNELELPQHIARKLGLKNQEQFYFMIPDDIDLSFEGYSKKTFLVYGEVGKDFLRDAKDRLEYVARQKAKPPLVEKPLRAPSSKSGDLSGPVSVKKSSLSLVEAKKNKFIDSHLARYFEALGIDSLSQTYFDQNLSSSEKARAILKNAQVPLLVAFNGGAFYNYVPNTIRKLTTNDIGTLGKAFTASTRNIDQDARDVVNEIKQVAPKALLQQYANALEKFKQSGMYLDPNANMG